MDTDLILFAYSSGMTLRYESDQWQASLNGHHATGASPTEAVMSLKDLLSADPPGP